MGKWGRQGNENFADYKGLNLGGKSAYPQASERNGPSESENAFLATKPPPTPRENPPNILGFYVACPPGEKGGVVVIGAAVGAGDQHSLGGLAPSWSG